MHDILAVAVKVEDYFTARQWKFAFIGGIANLAWGEIRSTLDVDVTLFTSLGGEDDYVVELLGAFKSRISDARDFAREARVLLLESEDGIAIDVALAGFPYEELVIERRISVEYGDGIKLTVVSAEDLILMKAFAGRDQDWVDVNGIVRRQGPNLDWDYMEQHSIELAAIKGSDEFVHRLQSVRDR
jgi:predicted nucleotidyltransferase